MSDDSKSKPQTESVTTRDRGASRRDFLKTSLAAGLGAAGILGAVPAGVRTAAYAAGSDAPEKPEVKIGFIPLTDCASVVIASEMGFDKKYGIKITPSKEASWAAVRDKLVNGELDASHVLYGLIYGVQLGIGGPKKDMAVLMGLNHNGQAITLSNQLKEKGATDGAKLKALIGKEKREYTFAQTFPTGTHAMETVLLAGDLRHQPDERRQDHRRAAAADGRQHARRQHGWLLRGRAVGCARHLRQDRLHRHHHAGDLEGSSGEGAGHDPRVHQEVSEHHARHDGGGARGLEVHRCHGQPREGGARSSPASRM